MTNKELPTAAHIRYLLAIKKLNKGNGVRSVDIAEELGFSKPSVHSMMKVLSDMNYIKKQENNLIFLTDAGHKMAEIYELCYETVSSKLKKGISENVNFESAVYNFLGGLSFQALLAFAG